jgi:hypothetical protein
MKRRCCSLCHTEISAARLAAVPTTQLCVTCKAGNDEPPVKSDALFLRRSLAESSVGDLEEMQAQVRELGGIE